MIKQRTEAGSITGFFLSLLFAGALLGIQSIEFWLDTWLPDYGQSAPITLRLPSFSVFRLHLGQPAELVQRQVIIGRGEIIEPNEDARLATAYEALRRESQVGWSLGMFIVSLMAAMLLLAEFRRIPGASRLLRAQATILVLVLLFAFGAKLFLLLTSLPTYYFPMPAIVLLSAFIFGRRVALAVNLFTATVFASLLGFDVSAFIVLFMTSYAGTLFLRDRKKRRVVIQAGSLSGWFGALALLVLMLVFSGAINVHRELLNPDYSAVLAAVVCGVFSGVFAFLGVEPVGWLIGRVSPAKLLELQNLDSPILKQIRDEAPGTWEHSRAAANLAEAAAAAIGADSLLVRVGAYIHDAGKALNPAYFIENQTALEITNPHNELEPEVSADCIFDHVREGTELLRKHHVPEAVIEFAYTHHGTSLLEYFWVKTMQAGNPKGLKEKAFRYPGMRPRSRETGILMIVDAVEAASRTIKEPAKHKFENLVQRIVYTKLVQGQLDDCGLTLADLKAVTCTLVETLVNMYHARIEYPWQRSATTTQQTGSLSSLQDTGSRLVAPFNSPRPTPTDPAIPQAQSGEQPVQAPNQTGTHPIYQPHQTGPHPVVTPPERREQQAAQSANPTGKLPTNHSDNLEHRTQSIPSSSSEHPHSPPSSGAVDFSQIAEHSESNPRRGHTTLHEGPGVATTTPNRGDESSQTSVEQKSSRRKNKITLAGVGSIQSENPPRQDESTGPQQLKRTGTDPGTGPLRPIPFHLLTDETTNTQETDPATVPDTQEINPVAPPVQSGDNVRTDVSNINLTSGSQTNKRETEPTDVFPRSSEDIE